ncbi:zinc finger protein 385B [Drosophila takahashii]|uniref:zinc finger protein 385B n=1 Tax=Drosophila takahashii TaxID=29030 RepID=UPI001CF8A487|nr:uncharacterized protein LOC108069555 [Drosophila takahashii]
MWSGRYKTRPQVRLPVIHEQIAMQCARNIVRVASAMPQPQPRCPSGHVAVLVELRRVDEPTVHRYQVNVPSAGFPPMEPPGEEGQRLQQLVLPGTLEAMGCKLPQPERPPCPMHGRTVLEPSSATDSWSPGSHSGPPPLLMSQSSMHVVGGPNSLDFTTFSEPVVTAESPDGIRAHFMASLYQQQPSPLSYSDIWVQEGAPPPPREIASHLRPQLCLGENNEYVASKEARPINGVKAAPKRPPANDPRKMAELCLDSNGEYVPNEQLQRTFNRTSNSHPIHDGMRREQRYYGQHQSHQEKSPTKGLNGFKDDLGGYGYVGKEVGKPRNGYKDQPLAFPEPGNVLRQVQPQDPSQMLGRVAMIEPRVRQKATSEPQDKPSLPNVPEVAAPSEPPPTYPQELQALFRWNYCALCHTVMRTERNAVDHYSSRAHERRISSWLVRQFSAGGQARQDVAAAIGVSEETLQNMRTARPTDFYCDLCDLKLTSLMHAQQHFFGRRHRMVARQMTKPNGEGFYDPEGRWVRTDAKLLMCELCDVSITSESQMAMHMAGARHRRRVHTVFAGGSAGALTLGVGPLLAPFDDGRLFRVNANGSLAPAPLRPLGLQILPAPQPLPLSDPSAAFYCETCNITLNHVKSLKQHELGRMHRRNLHRLPGQPVFYE